MQDLTEATPRGEVVTAAEIIANARKRERQLIVDFLTAQAFQVDSVHMDTVLLMRDAVKGGAHL